MKVKIVDVVVAALFALMISLMLAGCNGTTVKAGVGAHYVSHDDMGGRNLMGKIEVEKRFNDRLDGYCMHISSIPDRGDTGLNICGVDVKLNP